MMKLSALQSIGFVGVLLLMSGIGQCALASDSIDAHQITSFTCGGAYLKIDPASNRVTARGVLSFTAKDDSRIDGCLAFDFHYDRENKVVIALAPVEARVGDNEERHYKVVVFNVDDLTLLDSYQIEEKLDTYPELYFSELRPGFVLKFQQRALHFLNVKSLSKPDSYVPLDRWIPPKNNAVGPYVGLELLDERLKSKFASLVRINSSGKPYLDVRSVDWAAGRTLYIIAADDYINSSELSGILVYDAVAKRVVSSFMAKYPAMYQNLSPDTPTVHFSPDGRFIFAEEYYRDSPKTSVLRKTGNIAIYDAGSGGLIKILTLDPQPTNHYGRVVESTSSGGSIYYASADRLYIVDGENASVSLSIQVDQATPDYVINDD